jgi:hypothetical protein
MLQALQASFTTTSETHQVVHRETTPVLRSFNPQGLSDLEIHTLAVEMDNQMR